MLPNFRKVDVEATKTNSLASSGMLHIASSNLSFTSAHRIPDRGIPSIIGQTLQITGNLISQGEVQVEGEVKGDIHGSHVIIGESAHIHGTIIADEIVVRGNVLGTVRGKKVHLQPTARVDGDIYHNTIAIEQGAYFEGKSRRVEDPTAEFEDDMEQDLGSDPSRQSHASLQDHLQHTLSRNSLYYGDRPKVEQGSLEEPELS